VFAQSVGCSAATDSDMLAEPSAQKKSQSAQFAPDFRSLRNFFTSTRPPFEDDAAKTPSV
jgi:hypothetical protein